MQFSLKRAAKNVFGIGGEEMDRIAELPMTKLRLELKEAWQEKKFTAEQYDAFVEKLAKVDDLKDQAAIAKAATEKAEVENELDIELNTPAKQLLWAATLTRLMDAAEEGPVAQTRLWKQLQDTMGVYNEAIRISKMLALSMQNDDVTYSWGQPGSWFYQDPLKNHLNFDLYFMLLAGFEFVRPVEGHEIGHSQLSTGYPPRMQELYEKVKQFIDPRTVEQDGAELPQLSEKEQIELAGEVAEWQYWHRAWNSMEDLTVDQFAFDLERLLPEQDFGDSMNHAAMVLRGYGEILRGDDLNKPIQVTTNLPSKEDLKDADIPDQVRKQIEAAIDEENKKVEEKKKELEEKRKRMTSPLTPGDIKDIKAGKISLEVAQKMYEEITRGALLSGYVKNGLFSDKDANYERFRVFADDIRNTVDMSKVADANGRDAFKYLTDLCSEGPDSIRLLQPKPRDRMLERDGKTVKESYQEVVAETTKARGEVMQKIWDLYIKPYADVMIEEFKQQTKKNLDQQKQQQNQQGNQNGNQQGNQKGDQQGKQKGNQEGNQQGDSQGGGGSPSSDGQSQSGGQQSSSGGGGQQQKDQNQKDQSGGGGSDEKRDIDKNLRDQIKNMAQNPQEKEAKEQAKNEKGQGQDGQGKDGDKQDANQQNGGGGENGDKPEQKDGQGQNGDGKPEQKKGKDKDGRGGPGWGQDQNQQPQSIKVGDMKDKKVQKEELSDEEKQAMKEAAKNMPKVDPNAMSQQAGNQRGVDLAALAKGDYRDFNRRCLELAPIINQVAEAYKRIREEQRRMVLKKSKNLDYTPPDGDIQDRMDRDKMLEAKFKRATGQKMTLDDNRKFHDDDIATAEATIEMFSMIDGSGSMPGLNLGNGVTAMEAAMQSAVINYMAARKAGIPAFIVMWGDSEPIVIATPDTPLKEVGEKVEALRNGTGSGTSLAPGLLRGVQAIAEYRAKPGTISGSTHILVYSDGDIGDPARTIKMLETIGRNSKNLSVDVAILRPGGQDYTTQMETAFRQGIEQGGGKMLGIIKGNDPNVIPLELSRLMLRRVRNFVVKSVADIEKRRALKRLHKKMKEANGGNDY